MHVLIFELDRFPQFEVFELSCSGELEAEMHDNVTRDYEYYI